MSVYSGPPATDETKVKCLSRISAAFPQLDAGFHRILLERVTDLGISDKRMIAAVKHVIDTCQYPTPTIAQFISYDKSVKLYNYQQMAELAINEPGAYKSIRVEGRDKPLWAHVNDIEKYDLELWNKQ